MARSRKSYNNMLILLVAGAGLLLMTTGRLTGPPNNSVPLLPEAAQVEALVFADLVVRAEEQRLRSMPERPETELRALLDAWRRAQLVPTLEPTPAPSGPTQVDVYLDDGSAPQTALLYPHIAAVKILGEPQWWRLVNEPMAALIPQDEER
ncbi:hypothetical protein [Ferrimonas balearica]|uniref:hypothetical protein n=1 Tax=Ferrimonas balearica TaxID=44012 RepID=UPI001C99BF16|nr:hypothetical protein [Ferrimonas balearica]MBY5994090.1 hypothetical protein [Ferrimonas balearica]